MHSHSDLDLPDSLPRWLNVVVAGIGLATLAGMLILWPRGEVDDRLQQGVTVEYVDGTVASVERDTCDGISAPTGCQVAVTEITSGPTAGESVRVLVLDTEEAAPQLNPGDTVVLLFNDGAIDQFRYTFVDFQRAAPLALLVGLFVIVVVAFGRWQGVRALLGLAVSLGVIMAFVLPALTRASSPIAVAVVGASFIAFAALYLAHGVTTTTTVALLGTLGALALITALATAFVSLASITGLVDDSTQTLNVTAVGVDLPGLVIAGTVLGALGVLDDVTITQVSTVAEVSRANPQLPRRQLYRRAVRVGRDHVASTVNTLVLAYAGASLALLLVFSQGRVPAGRFVTSELIATEIIRTTVGSIGLILAVPATTALAAIVTTKPSAQT